MNILLINGSPKGKKSNTYRLSTAFIDGIKEKNEIVLDEIALNRLDIKPCLGCFSCWNKTPGKCVINDEMSEVIQKLLWADVTIWSFPLYYFNVPSKLKTLIDRQLPMVLPFMVADSESGSHPARYDMTKKRNVLISTCGFYKTEGNYDSVIPMFDHLLGKGNYETIFCSQGELFRVPELSNRTNEYLEYVKLAGSEFVEGSITDATKKKLNTLLFHKETFEAMADASWGIEKNGEKSDESLVFTKQMAALYNKKSYSGRDIVLEMYYTDIDKCYQIVLGKDGYEFLNDAKMKYTTRIETPFSLWKDIARGSIKGDEALMKQMYKVKGDFDLMINWDSYFGDKSETTETIEVKSHVARTNMTALLIPWIVFWVAVGINNFVGSFIAIATCTMIPLIFYKNRTTIYEVISNVIVIFLSGIVILGINEKLILPLSYLCFGVMWTLSCIFKLPLTAHYSVNDYSDNMINNPLFIKTNKILTAMWGILYILTSISTYFLMRTKFSSYVGIINNIVPIFMGIFTVWFQKWYPAKVARGK